MSLFLSLSSPLVSTSAGAKARPVLCRSFAIWRRNRLFANPPPTPPDTNGTTAKQTSSGKHRSANVNEALQEQLKEQRHRVFNSLKLSRDQSTTNDAAPPHALNADGSSSSPPVTSIEQSKSLVMQYILQKAGFQSSSTAAQSSHSTTDGATPPRARKSPFVFSTNNPNRRNPLVHMHLPKHLMELAERRRAPLDNNSTYQPFPVYSSSWSSAGEPQREDALDEEETRINSNTDYVEERILPLDDGSTADLDVPIDTPSHFDLNDYEGLSDESLNSKSALSVDTKTAQHAVKGKNNTD